LRKATISFVMSVRLSARNSSVPTGRIFMKFDIWVFSENLSRKFKFHSNLTRITGTLHEHHYTFLTHVAEYFLVWEMFRTEFADKIKTHILCAIIFFPRKSCLLWDNVEKYWTADQATDGNMALGHCILDNYGYRHTLRICKIHCFSTATMLAPTRLIVKLQECW